MHYDLGFAYAEMGLWADAIAELETATRRDPAHASFKLALDTLRKLRQELAEGRT